MTPTVHILATCRKPELVDATLLVFKTLRVGFPTAKVTVWMNGDPCERDKIVDSAMKSGCETAFVPPTIHHECIRELLVGATDPFWICDTDIIFHKSVEDFPSAHSEQPLMGAFVPEFEDKWTRCKTVSRLHTSLLWFNPSVLEQRLKGRNDFVRISRFSPSVDLIAPAILPPRRFYDTCAFLFQAVSGRRFNAEQLKSYEHLHGATFCDELEEAYPGITALQKEIYKDNSKAIGSNQAIKQFYSIQSGNKTTLNEFCVEVCKGNPEAIEFCALWFHYCHLIDDLIDSEERPEHETLLEGFAMANALYTSKFYMANAAFLHPAVMSITNAYADSVAWEKSDVHRRKTISDVLRCCGNEMFFSVAYVCGGWKHQRSVSSRIRERSWELQHDANDQPN